MLKKELEQDNKVLEKAFELACLQLVNFGVCEYSGKPICNEMDNMNCIECTKKYFLKRVKAEKRKQKKYNKAIKL